MAAEIRGGAGGTRGRIARNTAIFSILTGLSRIAGLIREIVASSYFGTSGAFSAFTLAFQVPNLVRNLFADAALSASSMSRGGTCATVRHNASGTPAARRRSRSHS